MPALRALLPQLRDAWAESQPLLMGATANALESSYTTAGAGHRPARIDYLLTSGHAVAAELALADTGQGFSYSDHLGVAAVLRFGGAGDGGNTASNGGKDGGPGSNRFRVGAPRGSPARLPGGSPQNWRSRQQQDGAEGEHAELCLRGPAAFTHLMRRWPAPFQHAATSIEAAAGQMRQGRRQFVQLAAGLWAAGFGCLGALLARPWWQQCSDAAGSSYVALLSGMAAAFGLAGVLMIGGFVGRGVEMRALQQAAKQLRLAVGFCEAIA